MKEHDILHARCTEIPDLKRLLRAQSNIITKAPLFGSDDGIRIFNADPCMVGMVDLELRPGLFEEFEAPGVDGQWAGINVEGLYNVVNEAKDGDVVDIYFHDPPGDGTPNVRVEIESEDGMVTSTRLAVLNLDKSDVPSTSDLDFAAATKVDFAAWKRLMDRAAGVSDSVTLKPTAEALEAVAEGDEVVLDADLPAESDAVVSHEVDTPCSSMYSLDYIAKTRKLEHTAETLTIKTGDDFPAEIVATRPESYRYEFVLAPRIEDD